MAYQQALRYNQMVQDDRDFNRRTRIVMAKQKTKLELTWIGKENRPKLEPRILIEDPEKSYHAAHRVSDNDIFDNMLIFGDNRLARCFCDEERLNIK